MQIHNQLLAAAWFGFRLEFGIIRRDNRHRVVCQRVLTHFWRGDFPLVPRSISEFADERTGHRFAGLPAALTVWARRSSWVLSHIERSMIG